MIKRIVWKWCREQKPRWSGQDLARLLAVSHTYVRKLARDRKISHRKVGRKMFFTAEDINAYRQGTVVERAE